MIGILTFHWADDYGAMLQAYALRRSIERLGEEVEFIPYAPVRLTGRYWWCPLYARKRDGKIHYRPSRSGWKARLSAGSTFWKRRQHMRRFRRRYLTKSLPIRSAKGISLEKYRCVFVGSDQVWNPAITIGLDDAYIGKIGKRGSCRLVSYAASFGSDALPEEDRERFSKYVGENFSSLSVREQRAASFTAGLLHRKVENTLDPVLLLEKAEWERIGCRPPEEGYILIYWTEPNELLLRYADALAGALKKKIIQVSYPVGRQFLERADLRAQGGPAEFIGYIQNAACILTNSFHGTAFSVLLEKPFLVFRHGAFNARLENLLEKLGLLSRMRDPSNPPGEEDIWEPVEWESVRERLAAQRAQSLRFIADNLGGSICGR